MIIMVIVKTCVTRTRRQWRALARNGAWTRSGTMIMPAAYQSITRKRDVIVALENDQFGST
jgi:aspartate aminotransferase-like enzyme